MAHLHSGIMGPVSGKIGNLVYYTYRGKCFVRRAPVKTKKRPTLKQKIQRAKFALAMNFVSPVAELVNLSYRLVNRKKAGTSILLRNILNEGIVGKYPNLGIDYSKLKLVRGSLPWSQAILHQEQGSSRIHISWEMWAGGTYLEDELIVMMYCCTTGKWLFSIGDATRLDGACKLGIDTRIDGETVQIWIAFRSRDHKTFSDSEFLGEVKIYDTESYEN
ncbi:MAG: DUF6266 family protein [Bacteroidota bacterium]